MIVYRLAARRLICIQYLIRVNLLHDLFRIRTRFAMEGARDFQMEVTEFEEGRAGTYRQVSNCLPHPGPTYAHAVLHLPHGMAHWHIQCPTWSLSLLSKRTTKKENARNAKKKKRRKKHRSLFISQTIHAQTWVSYPEWTDTAIAALKQDMHSSLRISLAIDRRQVVSGMPCDVIQCNTLTAYYRYKFIVSQS